MNRIAIISDIHGNVLALEAVLEDIQKRQVTEIVNLGDSLHGPLFPEETWQLIRKSNMISISGNQDRAIKDAARSEADNPTLKYVLESLSASAFDWLEKLSQNQSLNGMYLCHGNLLHDDEPLIEKFEKGEVRIKSDEELQEELLPVAEKIILCAHTHVPRVITYASASKTIINPGSVGLPSYDDDFPIYHKMESGNPLAKYAILETDGDVPAAVTLRQIRYDYEKAAIQAEKNNRKDWAYWLRTGRA